MRISADLYERAAGFGLALPLDAKRRARIAAVRRAGVIFTHVPKNAGMAVSQALYGMQIKHASVRYFAALAPSEWKRLPSFAVLRDPVDRFRSAYRYARAGGGSDNRVSPVFAERYRAFGGIDDALDHVEAARSPYGVDHIFRPQCWYLTDRRGAIAVDHLALIERVGDLLDTLSITPAGPLRHVNRSEGSDPVLTRGQADRIRRIYADDLELFDQVARSDGLARLRGD